VVGQDGDDEICVEGVQVPGRLVQEQDHGVPHQLDTNHQPPVLRLGQTLHAVVGDLAKREVGQHLFDPGYLDIVGYLAAEAEVGGVDQAGLYRESAHEVTLLGHVATTLLEQSHGHRDPIERYVASGRSLSSPRNDLQQGSLARPLGAENCMKFSSVNLQGYILENNSSANTAYQFLKTCSRLNL